MTTRTITLSAEHWQTIKIALQHSSWRLDLCEDDLYVSRDLSAACDALEAALAQPEEWLTDEELITLDELKSLWNAQADPANDWDELGIDEILLFAQQQVLGWWGRPISVPEPEGPSDEVKGLHGKFIIHKANGEPVKYPCFVLRIDGKDAAAISAFRAYAIATEDTKLRQDMLELISPLAQPEPEGPTDEELDIVVIAIQRLAPYQPDGPTQPTHDIYAVERGREILKLHLARFGRPAIASISASEFLEPEWMRQEDQTRKTTDHAQLIDGEWWAPCSDLFSMQRILDNARAYAARPAIEQVPTPEPGTADHITDDEGTRWDRTMDAALWAKAFCLICPEMASQEDVMIGWFANAIMAGWDHRGWKAERKPVLVSDPPRPEDCDEEGRCWWLKQAANPEHDLLTPTWHLQRHGPAGSTFFKYTHWLPHWALPLPTSQP